MHCETSQSNDRRTARNERVPGTHVERALAAAVSGLATRNSSREECRAKFVESRPAIRSSIERRLAVVESTGPFLSRMSARVRTDDEGDDGDDDDADEEGGGGDGEPLGRLRFIGVAALVTKTRVQSSHPVIVVSYS